VRHLEENLKSAVKNTVTQVARRVLTTSPDGELHSARFSEKALLTGIDREAVYGYYDDPCSGNSSLMKKIRAVLVDHALANGQAEKDASGSVLSKINKFEEELREALPREMEAARVAFETGTTPIANRIKESRSYPLYRFIREDLGAVYLTGEKLKSPGEECNKVFLALSQGKLIDPMLDYLKEWDGKPLPIC
jgi:hypothetical protein